MKALGGQKLDQSGFAGTWSARDDVESSGHTPYLSASFSFAFMSLTPANRRDSRATAFGVIASCARRAIRTIFCLGGQAIGERTDGYAEYIIAQMV